MGLEIKPLSTEHIKECLEIYNYYVKSSTATFSIETIDEKEMETLAFTGLSRFPSFALMEEGKVVGYSLFNRYKSREAYDKTAEVTIYLHPDFHGKGYGKEAVKHLEQVASQLDFRALLAVICAENLVSIKLFEGFGYFECAHFKQVGEKFGRILDVVVLEKLLEKE